MPILYMGNKNYSSWSIRPWFFMRQAGIDFECRVLPMNLPSFAEDVARISPSRRVPVLDLGAGHAGERDVVWDSLAIGETLAELYPDSGVWPADAPDRRLARAACAEMHAGFGELRRVLTCNARRVYPADAWRRYAGDVAAQAAVLADVARVHELWDQLLTASSGPFLGGPTFGYVDAFFVPVVSRFRTYAMPSPRASGAAYRARIEALPTWAEWMREAEAEPHTIDKYEYA
jgi:glutathione S-transferase